MTNATGIKKTLVLGGTGKTGRRVVERLAARAVPTQVGSRSGRPPFDWADRSTWAPVLEGVGSAYLSYYPDLAVPGATDTVGSFAELAVRSGVRRLVLLAGRGEPEAEEAEDAVRASGAELTIARSTWLAQNFSEDYIAEEVRSGEVALPARDVPEPFVDADDIADVAVAALTDDRHIGIRVRRIRCGTKTRQGGLRYVFWASKTSRIFRSCTPSSSPAGYVCGFVKRLIPGCNRLSCSRTRARAWR